jgi:hypothetical protein
MLDSFAQPEQTFAMPATFIEFTFGTNEDAAQQARHKLEGWKQAFRLDKKLQFKFDRAEAADDGSSAATPSAKPKAKGKAKTENAAEPSTASVNLLVRLYFSDHEKLSAQRWIERIPADDLFKVASPRIVRPSDPGFAEIEKRFDDLA